MIRYRAFRDFATHGRALVIFALVAGPMALPAAGTASFESTNHQVVLLELYTSEGCSSCPPADRWLSTLKTHERLWTDLVPVAFHVDYWDYIGWRDRFASPAYSARQRTYASRGHAHTVYTPGLFLNGNEWRSWFTRRSLEMPGQPEVGILALSVRDKGAQAQFVPVRVSSAPVVLHLVILGFDIHTSVRAGENRGRELRHDFVVLGYDRKRMEKHDGRYQVGLQVPEPRFSAPTKAIAAWVSLEPDPRPVQAVGGWLN